MRNLILKNIFGTSFRVSYKSPGLIGLGLSVTQDYQDYLLFSLTIFTVGIYIGFSYKFISKFLKFLGFSSGTKNFGFGLSVGGTFQIDCGLTGKDGNPRSLVYLELAELLGQKVYSEAEEEKGEFNVEMPEGEYKGEYRSFISYWKRPFGFTSKMRRISIKMTEPIPIPGPPGQDMMHGLTMPFHRDQDLVDAKMAFINSVSHHRAKVGGNDWKPM